MKRVMALATRVVGNKEGMAMVARAMAMVTRLGGKQQQQGWWQWPRGHVGNGIGNKACR
jgi:hypothetical protein